MPNIKHLDRKSLAWLDWRWRLQLLGQNIPSHRRGFWCMDLGRFSCSDMLGVQILDQGIQYRSIKPRDIAKNGGCHNDVPCRITLKVTVHWIAMLQPAFLWVFPFVLSFDRFHWHFSENWEKLSRSCRIHRLLVATAPENSLPWQAFRAAGVLHRSKYHAKMKCSTENMLQNPVWDTSSDDFCALTQDSRKLSNGYDSSSATCSFE